MEAAFIPEVKDEMDTQNFEKFEESEHHSQTSLKPGPWRKLVKIGDISKECEVVRVDKGSGLLKVQEAALRKFPDIVVATPGRMIDHLCNSMSVHLDELAILILDEADRLLELGFSAKISELVKLCPKRNQTMLFSATMTAKVGELVTLSLNKPLRLSADPLEKCSAALTEEVVRIRRYA